MNAYTDHVVSYLIAQSWQIALLAGIVGLISWVLRDRSAHIRYLLWLIVLAKCLVPPLLTVPLGVLPDGSTAPFMASVGQPEGYSMLESPVSARADPRSPESRPVKFSLHEWIALVWALGVISFLLWVGGRAVRYSTWLRDRRRPLPPALEKAIQGLSVGFKLKRLPRIWLLEDISQPFVWGVLRGSVYLPAEFTGLSGSDRQRGVLAHELSHVARFDAGVNLFQVLAQAAYWFHPLVWWSNRKIRQEREKCCDEMAVVQLNTPPERYTEAIVDALAAERRSAHPIPSLAIVGSVKDIEERIKTMLKPGKKFHKRPSLVAATVVLLIALVTIPTALVLTARGAAQPAAKSVASDKPEQPRFIARTFNSTVALEVWVRKTSSPMTEWRIGRTPSDAPLEIPPCQMWLVRTPGPVEDWTLLAREINQNRVPGLSLGAATDSDLTHLADLAGLQQLNLAGKRVTDKGLQHLKDLTTLQGLMLANMQITDSGLEHLAGLTGLQRLWLIGCPITDANLAHLKHLTGVQDLGFLYTQITDTGLVHLNALTGLRFLYLGGTQFTDAGLAHLKGLTALRSLSLTSTQVTDAGLALLAGLTGLQELTLGGNTQVTDAGLAHLQRLTSLQRLGLDQTRITDAGLEHLKDLTQLQELRLGGTLITDAGLAHIYGLTRLRSLDLSSTHVTDAGVQQLKQSLPTLTVSREQAK